MRNGTITEYRDDDYLGIELLIQRRRVPSPSRANRTDVLGLVVGIDTCLEGYGVRSLQNAVPSHTERISTR